MHQKNQCSIKGWKFEPGTGESAAPPLVNDWVTAGASSNANKRPRIADSESEEPLAMRRRSDRLGPVDEGMPLNVEHRRNGITLPLRDDDRSIRQTSGLLRGGDGRGGGIAKTESPSALVQAGQFNSDDLLEMEDWEIRPGRIRATGPSGPDSKPRLY